MSSLLNYGLLALSSVFLCIGNLLIKQATIEGKSFLSPLFLLGIAVFTVNMGIYSKALEKIPLSIAYPIFASLGYILIAISSIYFFQETLSLKQWLGISMILLGLYFIVK
jgi:multidrug transporter EmrE-like cation transporter